MTILRRTVASAFSPPAGENNSAVEPGAPRGHSQAITRFFRNLLQGFRDRSALLEDGRQEPGREPGGRLLEGLEFLVDTPRGVFLFHNSFHGAVSVQRLEEREDGAEVELLGVQRLEAGYVPIRKTTVAGETMQGTDYYPAAFSYTSVNELVEEYLGTG